MADWSTIANLGTAGGTALPAVATFSATRSANSAARNAERGLLDGLRPILVPTRWEDYIAPGDGGFCQVALREPGTEQFLALAERAKDREPFILDVLYGDVEGGNLDRADPR